MLYNVRISGEKFNTAVIRLNDVAVRALDMTVRRCVSGVLRAVLPTLSIHYAPSDFNVTSYNDNIPSPSLLQSGR